MGCDIHGHVEVLEHRCSKLSFCDPLPITRTVCLFWEPTRRS